MKVYSLLILSLLFILPLKGFSQDWEKIGEKILDKKGKEVIYCSHKGKFRMLKFQVENATVEFEKITLEFLNGGNQNINVRQSIRSGGETRAIDLKGNKRIIKKIEFNYDLNDTKKYKKKPRIILYGKD